MNHRGLQIVKINMGNEEPLEGFSKSDGGAEEADHIPQSSHSMSFMQEEMGRSKEEPGDVST